MKGFDLTMDIDKMCKELAKTVSNENIILNEPMKKYTSFKIGGNADIFIKLKDKEQLKQIIKIIKEKDMPLTIIGNGTNILVRDEGIRGVVLKPCFDYIKKTKTGVDKVLLQVGSGVTLPKLSQFALKENLTGLEFAVGIPGSIGGAIKMNAGAYGGQIQDIVVSTTYINLNDGKEYKIENSEHEFEYRNSVFSKLNTVILDTTIQLSYGNYEQIKKKMEENITSRKEKQPTEHSAGSTFKRGNGYITAELIDKCGLKGYTIGDAMVSTKHAGFIVNKGNAKAQDVIQLIEYIKNKIKEKFNVDIELEIEII